LPENWKLINKSRKLEAKKDQMLTEGEQVVQVVASLLKSSLVLKVSKRYKAKDKDVKRHCKRDKQVV